MDEGTFAVYQMIQPLIDRGGILNDHQILSGKGVIIIHEQLKDMDGKSEIVAVYRENSAGRTEIPALKLRRQIVLGTGTAPEMDAGNGIQQIKAVVIQHGNEPIGGNHDVFAVQVAHDAVVGMQIGHCLGQVDGNLQIKHPVVIGKHGLGLGHITAPGNGADFNTILNKGHGIADKNAPVITQNILGPGQSENYPAAAVAQVGDGMLHHVANFLFYLRIHLFVDFSHQVLPGDLKNAALAAGADFFFKPVAAAVSSADQTVFLNRHETSSYSLVNCPIIGIFSLYARPAEGARTFPAISRTKKAFCAGAPSGPVSAPPKKEKSLHKNDKRLRLLENSRKIRYS